MKKAPVIYDKAMHEARKYWRDRLESTSFEGHVPLDHPRQQEGERQLSSLEQSLDEEVNALLQRLTAGNHFLLYTVLLLAHKICVYKYCGERNVTVISPATSEGALPNLLPISSTLDADSSFKDALMSTKNLLSGAYKHQQYPFSRMLLDMPDGRRPKYLPMIAAMEGFNGRIPDSQCDIVVLFETTKDSTKATFRYDNRLYDESTILHFFKSFSAILHQGLGEMGTRVADLRPDYAGISGSPGRDDGSALVSATSGLTEAVGVEGPGLHRLIEAQVSRHPESVAVVEGARVTSYKALDHHAERLAATLADLTLDVRKPVAIMLDAGTEMIVSMLAAMKAGVAFAPVKLLSIGGSVTEIVKTLDVECIICRREHIEDLRQFRDHLTGVEHCITVEYPASTNGDGAPSLEITRHRGIFRTAAPDVGQELTEPVQAVGQAGGARGVRAVTQKSAPVKRKDKTGGGIADDGRLGVACVLVDGRNDDLTTSSVTHAELASLFQWLNERCGIGTNDRCLLSPGLGACEQLYDTLGMLVAGAAVEITDASSLKDTSLLAERLLAGRITVWDLPTPLMQNLLADLLALCAERKDVRGPRNILLDGEKQCVSLAGELMRRFPGAMITGLYSNPAVGIWTTVFPFRDGAAESDGAVIAQPIPGFEHRVLNKNGEPSPSHAKGELHLRRLFPPAEPGESASPRDVKTGLRAEPLEGGRLGWLRGDEHCFVKFGCGVELTKVEAALCRHEHIRAAEVITVKSDRNAGSLVVAFIIADPDHVSAEAARDFLVFSGKVDLIPDRFIPVDEFPLTADGAIDRDVLVRSFVTSHEPRDATGSIEAEDIHRRLKVIWLEALQLDAVDDDESFFAQGGNSLKATLLIARIRDEFSVDLSVQNFFRKPSTRAVAQLIEAESRDGNNLQKGPDFKAVPREKYRVRLPETEG